jgi:Protein of unknown function (DUF3383)
MATNASLPISSLISVTASLAAAAAQGQTTSSLLILGSSPVIDVVTRMETFSSLTEIAELFGAAAPETLAATPWFAQSPQPTNVLIGRWAKTATSGQLFGSPLTAAQQLITAWQAVTDGGFTIAIDGSAAEQVTGIDFATATNLNAVAAMIQAKLTGATIVYNAISENFVITSATAGATSSVSFATAPTGVGVSDISAMLGLTQTSSGAYQANGIAAESALTAATLFDQMFGQQWYAMSICGAADSDHMAVAPFLAATTNKHFYQVSTQETGVLVATDTSDIAAALMVANVAKTAVQYSGSSPYAGISLLGRILTVDYSGTNTAIALMYQNEPGITPDTLNSLQLASLLAKNCNGFLAYNNGASIIQPGICSNGQYIDTVIGADALILAIQSTVFNLLHTSTTKIPQTDSGMHQIKVAIEQVLAQFVANGFIAPGIWNGPLFGSLQAGSDGTPPTLTKGYYVYQPPVALQSATQRSQRISVPFQIAVNLAGAVQTVNVAITLNN